MSVPSLPSLACVLLSATLLVLPQLASAEEPVATPSPRGTYVWVPQDLGAADEPQAAGEPHILYLNRCVGGTTITAGWPDDNTINRSGILGGTVNFPPFSYGDGAWQQVMDHTREIFSPFNVLVTDVDPSPAPHDEALVCGSGGLAGFSGAGGVAPFTCEVIDKPITFTFPDSLGGDPRTIAEVIAQEAAHAWGLEHEYKCEDPMSYLSGCGDKTYQDGDYSCGEFNPRSCDCGGVTQNSYQYIVGLFGSAVPDLDAPNAVIVSPSEGDAFAVGDPIDIVVEVSDDIGVTHVGLYLDGELATEALADPYGPWRASDLPEGTHEIYIEASDGAGKTTSSAVVSIDITADGEPPAGGGGDEGGEGPGGGDEGGEGEGGSESEGDDRPGLPPGFGSDGAAQGCACASSGAPGFGFSWALLMLLGWTSWISPRRRP